MAIHLHSISLVCYVSDIVANSLVFLMTSCNCKQLFNLLRKVYKLNEANLNPKTVSFVHAILSILILDLQPRDKKYFAISRRHVGGTANSNMAASK